MRNASRPAFSFAFALFTSIMTLSMPACAEDSQRKIAEVQSLCATQGGLYGSEEEMYCLNYFGARLGHLAHSLMPSLCLACTLICDDENLDYSRCRERCALACGLEGGEGSATARLGPSPLAQSREP